MSHPDLRLQLTRLAQQDLQDLLQYSLEQWGPEQRDRYAAALERGMALLLMHPDLGRSVDNLTHGSRTYLIEQHIGVYNVRGRTPRILRIIHSRRDIRRTLQHGS